MQNEKRQSTKLMLKDQEKELQMKQKMREEIRKKEDDARNRRDQEKRENDRRIKEAYERKAALEEAEARKAEKLVKGLEKREKEWMMKLRDTQTVQETAFEQLETALLGELNGFSVGGYGNTGMNNGRSNEEFPNCDNLYTSSSANANMKNREKEKSEPVNQKPNSPTAAGINIVKNVSSRGNGSLQRVSKISLTQPRGRAPVISLSSNYSAGVRYGDQIKRSGSKSR